MIDPKDLREAVQALNVAMHRLNMERPSGAEDKRAREIAVERAERAVILSARAALAAQPAANPLERCSRCGRYEDGSRPCPNGDAQCPWAQPAASGEAQQFESRADGKVMRRDRWEWGVRRIVALLWGNRREFEIDEVVEAVRSLVPVPVADGDDEALAHAAQNHFSPTPPQPTPEQQAALQRLTAESEAMGLYDVPALPTEPVGLTDDQIAAAFIHGEFPPNQLFTATREALVSCARKLLAAIPPVAPLTDAWRPIDTAPKDGSEVLLYAPDRLTYGSWSEPSDKPNIMYRDGFAPEPEWEEFKPHWASWDGGFTEDDPPTHWMPLPAPPLESALRAPFTAYRRNEMNNRIWFDTEFIEDGKTIDLISFGCVREDGAVLYLENAECDLSKASTWVAENVLPHLTGPRVSRAEMRDRIVEFAGTAPQWWAYYASYDWVALCQLFGTMMDLPKGWPMHPMDLKQSCMDRGNPKLPAQDSTEHNALADAIWTRDACLWLEASQPGEKT